MTELGLPSNLAGFESSRAEFYGAERYRNLGLKLLPGLKHADLHICGSELAALRSEVDLILDGLPGGLEGDYWRFRLGNIKTAIDVASSHGEAGCVEIG